MKKPPDSPPLKPWLVVMHLPECRYRIMAAFARETEALQHLAFLRRVCPHNTFEVVFDAPIRTSAPKLKLSTTEEINNETQIDQVWIY